MTADDLCRAYLDALGRGDLEALTALFTPEAVVTSPLYGEKPVRAFFDGLFAVTTRSDLTLLHIFRVAQGDPAVALHFRYDWTMSTGARQSFEVVDVFRLAEGDDRFASMTIIYDTAPLRADFDAADAAR